jgi:hypothetical protein
MVVFSALENWNTTPEVYTFAFSPLLFLVDERVQETYHRGE